jgi:hypothetical protein
MGAYLGTKPLKPRRNTMNINPTEVKSVIPHLEVSESPIDTNGFTIGKKYPVHNVEGQGVTVLNDNKHERFVCIDGKDSAHIMHTTRNRFGMQQRSAGYFEIICK